ncbi:MAG TPA: glucose-6-phosphate dehydrogenase, partial [Myxococcales bacterium]|nr:glucose-6-phosphate dehydrogenase [Myxococcales bacterium]
PLNEEVWEAFAQNIHFVPTPDDAGYEQLGRMLDRVDAEAGTNGNRLFYLATPPQAYAPIIRAIGTHRLRGQGWSRVVVEKPFGRDLQSATELTRIVHEVFREDEVFRIDHYLGKETVQNILVLRFANGIFEPVWNRQYVDHVQITASEELGIESRARYYEEAGILRDMIQNHVLQLVCLTAMEAPVAFDADAVRDEKIKVLRALCPIDAPEAVTEKVILGQYVAGQIAGQDVPGYQEEKDVATGSRTPTFVALKLLINSWRWDGVPFYVRSGKRLPKRATEIAIHFRRLPHSLFGEGASAPNILVIRVQPEEGIALRFSAKVPGERYRPRTVSMDFRYGRTFAAASPEAYERLLLDALKGDQTLFTRRDEVEAAWKLVGGILQITESKDHPAPFRYPAGTWGPHESDALLNSDGRAWRRP